MKFPCDSRVACPDPGPPLTNYSSEDPDRLTYFGRYYVGPGGPPFSRVRTRGWTIISSGCTSYSSSFWSASAADLCAARETAACTDQSNVNDPCTACDTRHPETNVPECCDDNSDNQCCCDPVVVGPNPPVQPPPDPPQPTLFANLPQSCSSQCADGGTYTYTVPAGMFVAQSQEMANRMALTYACQQAAISKLCINCISLVEGKCDNPYSATLQASGGTAPYRFELSPDTPLPAGLNFSETGQIIGTPTGYPSTTKLTITVIDSSVDQLQRPAPRSATQDCYLVITGPKFLSAPPDGTECSIYGSGVFAFQTFPTNCTFTGTNIPEGLTLHSNGVLDGVPLQRGSFLITVTAVDPVSDEQNSKQFVINIAAIAGDTYTTGGSTWQCVKSLADYDDWLLANGGIEGGGANVGPVSLDATAGNNKNVMEFTIGPGNGGLTAKIIRRVAVSACSAQTIFSTNMTVEWHPFPGGSIKVQAYNMGIQVPGLDFTQFYGVDGSSSVIATSPIHTAIGVSMFQFDIYLPLNRFCTVKITTEKL